MTSRSLSFGLIDKRLDAYFATLRSRKHPLGTRGANWHAYAAAAGSAIAMMTSASASSIYGDSGSVGLKPAVSVLPVDQHARASHIPVVELLKLNAPPRTTQASQGQAPVISPGGVVPVFGTVSTIQPGEWISIYGSNLATGTATWNGDFPQSLAGTSVTINGRAAYLLYVSPTQINLQAPDDTATGTVPVVVTTAAGSATSTVTLSQFAPSFCLLDTKHVAGIILRKDGRGAYGQGTYDILGPTGNTLGYQTVAAKPGDTVVLYGVGFGPTTPFIPAGQLYSGAAPAQEPMTLYLNNGVLKPTFIGLSGAGLYQINLRIPNGAGYGDVPLQVVLGGAITQPGVVLSLEFPAYSGGTSGNPGVPPVVSSHPPVFTSFPVGTFTGGGNDSSQARKKKTFEPKLHFPPQ